jgi:hypothetical protein
VIRDGVGAAPEASRTLRSAEIATLAMAAAALLVISPTAGWRAGLALALGLAIGAFNGRAAARSLTADVSFRAASLARLGVLTALGVGAGFLLGTDVAWLALIGLAIAQVALAAAAFREALSNR